jgi:DNA-binding NarL/FixJ family response regulator
MPGGTLLVSRLVNWFPHFKMRLEELGFPDVHATCTEKDGLNMLINELKPGYVLMGSNFYDCGTPYMAGQMLSVFPKLNIAVLGSNYFPDAVATWFMFHGIKSYVKVSDSKDEIRRGLQCVLNGKKYVAPDVQNILNGLGQWPVVPLKATRRQKEILLMLCCGFTIKRIEDRLHVCKATVENHVRRLMLIFNSNGREELIKTVFRLEIFSKNELCFSDTSSNNIILPGWAKTQQRINQIKNEK